VCVIYWAMRVAQHCRANCYIVFCFVFVSKYAKKIWISRIK
jgi:hypothetical protein